jgi:hyperosmotically inducible protein
LLNLWWLSNFDKETLIMKYNRLFATAALLGAISFAMPICVHAQDNSVEGGAKEMWHGAKADVKDASITTKIKGALDTDPITKSSTIHVDTDNGIVNLTGDVPNARVMAEAQKVAQNTENVKAVRNNLTVAAPSNASGM